MGKYRFDGVTIVYAEFDGDIDVDAITETHYDNLSGEEMETTRILNGLSELKAETEDVYERAKFETKRVAAQVKNKLRREAAENKGKVDSGGVEIKVTDDCLKELVYLDKGYQKAANNEYKAKKDFEIVSPLYWQVKAKMDKINHIKSGGKKISYNFDD